MRFSPLFSTALFLGSAAFCFGGCQKDDDNIKGPDGPDPVNLFATGLNATDNFSTTPITPTFGFGTGQLPSQVDLTPYLPPMGNQGTYGTCAAWAVGYNLKTAADAISVNETGAALADPNKQASPKYLFTSIPDNRKGTDCNGTGFEEAFEVMRTKGIASQAEVPYTSLGNCSQASVDPSWDQLAAKRKIQNYRRIDASLNSIKQALADKQPVAFGAKLGQSFFEWRGDGVINSSGNIDPNAKHALHAMAIVGYDDNKGAKGAFRVVNSWDVTWGDAGFIWIDYDYLINTMLMKDQNGAAALFVATSTRGTTPDDNKPNPPNNNTNAEGELLTWMFDEDVDPQSNDPRDRVAVYDIYNFSSKTVSANSNWDIYYLYYNAYDINDYGVLFHNQITSSASSDPTCNDQGCMLKADIPGESSLGTTLFDDVIAQGYTVPKISGEYFLLMIADAEEEIIETDEIDNYFFPSLEPLTFNNGIFGLKTQGQAPAFKSGKVSTSQMQSLLSSGQLKASAPKGNMYSPAELKAYAQKELNNGNLAIKARAAKAQAMRATATSSR